MTIFDHALRLCEDWIGGVLVEWVNPSISDGKSGKFDSLVRVEVKMVSNRRNIMACVTFSHQVDVSVYKLRVLFNEAD